MKAIFCLPAHPSYFDDEYSQEEIEEAIKLYDKQSGGMISAGNPRPKVEQEFRLLREPGKDVTVIFYSSGYGDSKEVPEHTKQHGIDQYRRTSHDDLQTHVHNIKELLKFIRSQ